MIRPDTLGDGHRIRYGLGLFVDRDEAGRKVIHHGGAIYGFLSEARYYPDEDLRVVVLMNTLGAARPEAVATALADRILGQPEPTRTTGAYPGDAEELTGTYTGRGWGRSMTVVASPSSTWTPRATTSFCSATTIRWRTYGSRARRGRPWSRWTAVTFGYARPHPTRTASPVGLSWCWRPGSGRP